MIGWIKSNTVDKYLYPVREQIKELTAHNKKVLEIGCGTGDLLTRLADKIDYGLGLDVSKKLIKYANSIKQKKNLTNLEFQHQIVSPTTNFDKKFDYTIASLFFHIPSWENSVEILKRIAGFSETVIVAAFSKPLNSRDRLGMWLDQRFTGHYSNYKKYVKYGCMEGLVSNTNHRIQKIRDTFDPTIKIYSIVKH